MIPVVLTGSSSLDPRWNALATKLPASTSQHLGWWLHPTSRVALCQGLALPGTISCALGEVDTAAHRVVGQRKSRGMSTWGQQCCLSTEALPGPRSTCSLQSLSKGVSRVCLGERTLPLGEEATPSTTSPNSLC